MATLDCPVSTEEPLVDEYIRKGGHTSRKGFSHDRDATLVSCRSTGLGVPTVVCCSFSLLLRATCLIEPDLSF